MLQGLNSSDILRWVAGNISRKDLALVCLICWGIWFQRNQVVHGKQGLLRVSADLGEFLALHEGLLLARQFGFLGCWVEVDASNVAAAVQNRHPSLGVAGSVLDDMLALCSNVQVYKCLAIPRSGNVLAHNLASEAFSSNKEVLWQGFSSHILVNTHDKT
ncbi:hypothetical protein ACOSQ4_006392 [Xanthoceras sorbifolium]